MKELNQDYKVQTNPDNLEEDEDNYSDHDEQHKKKNDPKSNTVTTGVSSGNSFGPSWIPQSAQSDKEKIREPSSNLENKATEIKTSFTQ